MHIEPGVVDGAKIILSYATAAASFGLAGKMALDTIRNDGGIGALAMRSVATTALVFGFFEILPHYPVGVSEVHLILGSTLFLLFGGGAATVGLALGLLLQGLFFAPSTRYVDLKYTQALALSTTYQAGIVAWVGFWALYGHGFTTDNLANIATFGAAYMAVILLEPLVDLGVLALAKTFDGFTRNPVFHQRLHHAT